MSNYMLGMLWKFGTIRPGTGLFMFQSYDKLNIMEYIRDRLAPDKKIKILSRKDKNNNERSYYKLVLNNNEWAEKVKLIDLKHDLDLEFIRGLFEAKSTISDGCLILSVGKENSLPIIKLLSEELNTGMIKENNAIRYGKKDARKIAEAFIEKNPEYWNEVIKKMNPDT